MVLRILKWALILVVALVVLAVGAVAFVFYRAMPDYSGTASLPGLSAEVRVYRDGYGVPHIFAATMDDAARALGYIHASERLFEMETQRRAGQGRLAEILGADLIGVDKFIRTLGFYREAETSFEVFSPEAKATLQAYADGVNAFLASHRGRLPPEFLLLGDDPEPWRPADTLVAGKLLSLQLSSNYKLELDRAELAAKMPADEARLLFPMPPPGTPITVAPAAKATHAESISPLDQLGALLPFDHGASNQWVIAGARTATGKPILANDPHLGIAAPIVWYLARIVTPEGWVKGASLPGSPIVVLGQNDHIAWGSTNTGSDVQDLFVETVDPSDPSRYMTPDGPRPFETHDETIHVKGAPDVVIKIRATRHGPVMSDVDSRMASLAGAGKVMALAYSGLGDHDTTVEAFLRLNRAKDWNEFRDALKLWQTPEQNLTFADTAGNIAFISPGLLPIRKSGDGLVPADGASGANDWVGFAPFDKMPQVLNPSAGFFFNANNAIVPPNNDPYLGQDWEEPYRARRLQQFFDTIDKHTLDTSEAMQGDLLSLAAKDLLPVVALAAPSSDRARQALALLAKWDGVMDKDRPEPLIFDAWMHEMRLILINERTGLPLAEKGPFAASALAFLIEDHPQWCDGIKGPDPDCHAAISRAFDQALDRLVQRDGADMSKWRWGAEHVSILTNQFYSHLPLFGRLSDLSVSSSGDFYALDRGGGFNPPADRPFARVHAAGYRGIYDLGDPDKSRFMIATGESGHIFSGHYGDLVPLWNDVKAITLAGAEDELKQRGASEFVFETK
ncbi:MAG TPA: penicillin acylase family protein [Roseiarcus sp.]|nr:penicillin acylase family protein [Roseiarcus sp.]